MAVSKKDYYEALGISRNASEDEIKQAFRRLAVKHHPDRNPDNKKASEEKFKEISEAYEVLSDAQKKAAYDQHGHEGVGFGHPGGFQWQDFTHTQDLNDIFGGGGLEDLFASMGLGDIMGGARGGRRGAGAGANLEYSLTLELAEAATGKEVPVTFHRKEECSACKGQGTKSGSSRTTCSDCKGQGQVRISQGIFVMASTCPRCRGEGSVIKDPCASCRGQGRVSAERKVTVKVPAGIDSGMRLKLSGEGEAGVRGAPRGDLFVLVRVKEHLFFHREGQDIICEVPVSMTQASLGCELSIPTLSGQVTMKIPAGTQPGQVLRLRGRGMPSVHGGGKGDQLLQIRVEIPAKLSAAQKQLLEQFSKEGDNTTFPGIHKFWDQAKRWMGH